VGVVLLSATNPENGTVTYTYNSDSTLHTKTDAKSQVFTYSYDSYKRLTQIQVGSTVLRTFMYDTNTLDSNFSGSYTAGRLVAVQNAAFTPNGYGGGNISTPSTMQLVEMYAYTQAGLTSGKRLQVQETLYTTLNGVGPIYATDAEHGHSLHVRYWRGREGSVGELSEHLFVERNTVGSG